MYKVAVKVAPSPIDGRGVFAATQINKGNIVWVYEKGYDVSLSTDDYEKLPEAEKTEINKVGYLSPWSNKWVYPPANDPARYTNHSEKSNLSVVYDKTMSIEPHFIANRDIRKGEELTNNYLEFDKIAQTKGLKWLDK